jgi:multidrug efflux pump subunit AcrA (membrane-fusion protein)
MTGKRILVLFGVLGVVAATALLGWWAGSRIESPADAAARTAAPKPSPILVPVESRVLSSNIVTRGTARFGLPQPVSIVPSVLKSVPGLISTLPIRNKQIKEGDILFTASGRPVFVIQGHIPAYRDLSPGIVGEDVRQLEEGLKRLGFDPGQVDKKFDSNTSSAISKWYRSHGVEPFGATFDQLTQFRKLERDLGEANKRRQMTSDAVSSSERALKVANASADHQRKTAASELATAHTERAMIVLDPRQPKAARDAADKKLETAWAAAKKARLQGDFSIRSAEDALKLAKIDIKLAKKQATRLDKDLNRAKGKLGVQIPADEIIFIKELPVRIGELFAVIGAKATGKVMAVTDNQLAVDSSLTLETAPLVKPGMKVNIDEQSLGVKTTGTVSFVANSPGTRGVDGYHIYFEVQVGESKVKLEGYSLRLTIPIESTKGEVTAVPVSALSLSTDGTSRIQVEEKEGVLKYITVKPGMAADGYVEIISDDTTLIPGQLVVVGFDNPENELLQ